MSAQDAGAKPAGFVPIQLPVLGLLLEHDAAEDQYRVRRLAAAGGAAAKTLAVGTKAACETLLLATLKKKHGTGRINLALPTLGGKQFWADEFVQVGWRIQRNIYSEHCRLLDGKDRRRAWGTFEACRVAFEAQRQKRKLRAARKYGVVLLHGMGRGRASFKALAKALQEDGYEVVAISYPSTRRKILAHAKQVAKVLNQLDGVDKVSFVTHSMGGLVARELLSLDAPWRKRIQAERLVMLGPPNGGAFLADRLEKLIPYRLLAGDGGRDLITKRVAKMPVPTIPFAVIAGGRGDAKGYNPMIKGDDDGVVSVDTTKLKGSADFLRVTSIHTLLMQNADAIRAIRSFLKDGKLRAR